MKPQTTCRMYEATYTVTSVLTLTNFENVRIQSSKFSFSLAALSSNRARERSYQQIIESRILNDGAKSEYYHYVCYVLLARITTISKAGAGAGAAAAAYAACFIVSFRKQEAVIVDGSLS